MLIDRLNLRDSLLDIRLARGIDIWILGLIKFTQGRDNRFESFFFSRIALVQHSHRLRFDGGQICCDLTLGHCLINPIGGFVNRMALTAVAIDTIHCLLFRFGVCPQRRIGFAVDIGDSLAIFFDLNPRNILAQRIGGDEIDRVLHMPVRPDALTSCGYLAVADLTGQEQTMKGIGLIGRVLVVSPHAHRLEVVRRVALLADLFGGAHCLTR